MYLGLEQLVVDDEGIVAKALAGLDAPAKALSEHGYPIAHEFMRLSKAPISSFCLAERLFKKAERYAALDKPKAEIDVVLKRATYHHATGLDQLAVLYRGAGMLTSTWNELTSADIEKVSAKYVELANDVIAQLSDSDIKPSDIVKLQNGFKGSAEILVRSGPDDTLRHYIDRLSEVRNSPDRGATDNIPPWKLFLIIAIGLAFILTTLISLFVRGGFAAVWSELSKLVAAGWLVLLFSAC